MKLWLDDARNAPDGWTRAYNMADAVKLSLENEIEEMSLDHDLGPMPNCDPCEDSQVWAAGGSSMTEGPGFGQHCDNGNDCRCECHQQLQPSGYDFVKWMAETDRWPTLKPRVHSMNPVGAGNMRATIDRYWFNPRLH